MATLKVEIGGEYAKGYRQFSASSLIGELASISNDMPGDQNRRRRLILSPAAPYIISDLAPGIWEVSITTPIGKIVAKEVKLAAFDSKTLQFDFRPADIEQPQVQQSSRSTADLQTRSGVRENPKPWIGGFAKSIANRVSDRFRYAGAPTHPEVISMQSGPIITDHTLEHLVNQWASFADGVEGHITVQLALNCKTTAAPEPFVNETEIWTLVGQTPAIGRRTWLLASNGHSRRLHATPLPWHIPQTEDEVQFEARATEGQLYSRIRLLDHGYSGLLTYLSSGAVIDAANMLEAGGGPDSRVPKMTDHATEALRGKHGCPLGAAAAAYVLVGSEILSEHRPWQDWVSTLCARYEWIPDGAILLAQLKLQQAKDEMEGEAALQLLHEALRRGLPFYSVGWSWLLRGMSYFPDDPIVQSTRPLVERLASTMDMAAPFTTFNLRSSG